ncbi:MAG: methyltransferase domain-containing protein [Gammaproteobacteria bacterium]|nr:methyltransferase domain-containing protein [Gammaproteobacteria bacterium]
MRNASSGDSARHLPAARAGGACPCCGDADVRTVYEIGGVPTNSCISLTSRDEALAYPTGDIRLGFCCSCGFLFNQAFDPSLTEYSGRYEETQAFSPTFNAFHERLAHDLVERHELTDKDVLEIGCGKGEFLRLLCEAGGNRGLGFDPGYSKSRDAAPDASYTVIRDFFSERYADREADFVCSKMTLEHIPSPYQLLAAAARVTRRPSGVLFVQVPEATRIVRDCAFEDIYYEHCSYFTAGSLARLLERLGLAVISDAVVYDGQYLIVEAVNCGEPSMHGSSRLDDVAELSRVLSTFARRSAAEIRRWRDLIGRWSAARKRIVIWGAGSKGVAFLHATGSADAIAHAVDINPHRQGCHMPVTGHEIVGPQQLPALQPDVVIVMNRIYLPEIRRTLSAMDLRPELAALQPADGT